MAGGTSPPAMAAAVTNAGGLGSIAWAHGTSGVARQCAPSLAKDVYFGEEGHYCMDRRVGCSNLSPI
jgi:NAD(P)H-dependent flavin oxidoreductase YrpB (nitropropane dioxygenase family)